jgi:hypothetical protein
MKTAKDTMFREAWKDQDAQEGGELRFSKN